MYAIRSYYAGKQNPEILERSDYVLAVKKEWSNSDSVQLIFNHTGINADNLEIRDDWIYNTKTDQKVAKLIHNDDKDIDIVITPDLALKFIYNSNEIYLENVKDKKKIFRITSYNVCYTKLLRSSSSNFASGSSTAEAIKIPSPDSLPSCNLLIVS